MTDKSNLAKGWDSGASERIPVHFRDPKRSLKHIPIRPSPNSPHLKQTKPN